jgi:hypothetical protein
MSKGEVEAAMDHFDANGDGELDFNEFCEMVVGLPDSLTPAFPLSPYFLTLLLLLPGYCVGVHSGCCVGVYSGCCVGVHQGYCVEVHQGYCVEGRPNKSLSIDRIRVGMRDNRKAR